MAGFRQTLLRDERGTTVVDFALVAPLIVLITFGLFEVGRLYFTQTLLLDAVQNAARTAVVEQTGDPSLLRGVVEEGLAIVGASRLEAVDVTGPTVLPDTTRLVTIAARYRFEGAAGILPLGTVLLTAEASGYLPPS
jgi:Flp pilus assembly protein TadG